MLFVMPSIAYVQYRCNHDSRVAAHIRNDRDVFEFYGWHEPAAIAVSFHLTRPSKLYMTHADNFFIVRQPYVYLYMKIYRGPAS